AVKMIRSGTSPPEEALARFRREAEAVARLDHPNIVRIYDFGEHDGLTFFSMEFVDGGSLAKKLRAGPLPPEQAAGWVETLARTMHHVHQRHIVRRALKQANVLLTADGTRKIGDFGLAKCLDQDGGVTAMYAVMGTASYMAPEQAAGRTEQVGPA